ncbi:MAG: zinc-ribbon domain-containing protein [Desulfobacteraceae bacterium]|nr:zinc-ribbon domain-containing protein [Desulfobacteraceae bacterium]
MIIQCEQCRTKFKLDDSKVAEKSIKVRCARCRHVFSVSGMPEVSAPFDQEEFLFQSEEEPDTTTFTDQETALVPDHEAPAEWDFADTTSEFSLPSTDNSAISEQVETQADDDDLDFGAFDFGGDSGDEEELAVTATTLGFEDSSSHSEQAAPPTEEFGGLDFSGDDMFGAAAPTPAEEEASEPISFDMDMDGFADSMGVEGGGASQGSSLAAQDLTAENPFSLDDIDFGDELTAVAVQQVSSDELKSGQELLFAPLAGEQKKPDPGSDDFTFDAAPSSPVQEDLPPLSISSRRKETPRISGMLVFMGIIIAGLVVFYSYWGYQMLTENKVKTAQETGRIALRSVEAHYIKNNQAGELLVISGEAVNEYNKPRATIQIKGIVFGADGKELASKSAFCGNPLSNEQLTTMTMDKIEAAMANQFGDSLANMEVAPAGAIRFMIVMPKPPAEATDYGVEPVGSTVASAKEK